MEILKIRDDYDLSDLENLGFKVYTYEIYKYYVYPDVENSGISISIYDRYVNVDSHIKTEHLTILYDLIQEGIIEKVEI